MPNFQPSIVGFRCGNAEGSLWNENHIFKKISVKSTYKIVASKIIGQLLSKKLP